MKEVEIKGIKQVCSMSKSLKGSYGPMYLSVFYNVPDNRVFARYMVSVGHNSWIQYDHINILYCGDIYEPTTMEEIREIVFFAK